MHSRLLPLFTGITREPVDLKLFADYWTVRGDFRPVNKIPVQYQAVLMFRLCSSLTLRLQITVAGLCYKSDIMLVWVYIFFTNRQR